MFFISAEFSPPAATLLRQLIHITAPELSRLVYTDYGCELEKISIIIILLPKDILSNGGFSERILFQRKKKTADVRKRQNKWRIGNGDAEVNLGVAISIYFA